MPACRDGESAADQEDLSRAVEVARSRRAELIQALEALEAERVELEARRGRLRPPLPEGAAWSELPLPASESIESFRDEIEAIIGRRDREQIESAEDEVRDREGRRDARRGGGEVPDAAGLDELRSERDRLWNLVRRAWIDGEDVGAEVEGDDPLELGFEASIGVADDAADRMLSSAELLQAEAELARSRDVLEVAQRRGEMTEAELERIEVRWRELWNPTGITPAVPTEMAAWRDEVIASRETETSIADRERVCARWRGEVDDVVSKLAARLDEADASMGFEELSRRFRQEELRIEKDAAARAEIEKTLGEIEGRASRRTERLETIEPELSSVEARLREELPGLGASPDLDLDHLGDSLAVLVELEGRMSQLRQDSEVLASIEEQSRGL